MSKSRIAPYLGKRLVAQFQSEISPFSDNEISFCLEALYLSGAVNNIEAAVEKLLAIVDKAIANGDYNDYYDANIYEIFLDYQKESNFLDRVAKIIAKYFNHSDVLEVRAKIGYQENAYIDLINHKKHFFYYLNREFRETLGDLRAINEAEFEERCIFWHFYEHAEHISEEG